MPARTCVVQGRFSPIIEVEGREPVVEVMGRYSPTLDVTARHEPIINVKGREDQPNG